MTPSNRDYELIARRLDGESVELTSEQEALAEEIAADAAAVAPALDVAVPPGMLHRVAARVGPATAAARPLRWRLPVSIAAGLVVATLAGILYFQPVDPVEKNGALAPDVYVQELLKNPNGGLAAEIKAVETDLASAHAAVILDEPSELEVALADAYDETVAATEQDAAVEDETAGTERLQSL